MPDGTTLGGEYAREYHRHESGDVVAGPAVRCIDPDAGARDVLVLTPAELAARVADAWDRGVVAAHGSTLTLFAIKQTNPLRSRSAESDGDA